MSTEKPVVTAARMPISMLLPAGYNPRRISERAMAGLKASLVRFGELGGIVFNARTGHLVGGHQRVKALAALGETEVDVRVVDLPLQEEKAANVALNHSGIGGEWDDALLAVVLDEIQLELPDAFDDLQLADLLSEVKQAGREGLTDQDDAPPPPVRAVTISGDVWVMGRHRIGCMDSTDPASRNIVCGGTAPSVLMFDPPWDGGFGIPDGKWSSVLAFTDGQRAGDVVRLLGAPAWVFTWDCGACWYTPGKPLKRVKLALWYGDAASYDYDGAHYGEPGEDRTVTNSRGTYHYVPDPRGKHLADLFSKQLSAMHSDGQHRHEKPADWIRCLIGCCTSGDVWDPFAGSGVTIIACEQLGRSAFACELDPANVDGAVMRWQAYTGNAATLESDGRTFAEVMEGRHGQAN